MNLSKGALARRREATAPLLLGAGAGVALLSSSPTLRSWLVRAWACYALVRRIKGQ